jgi:hypothetical protein
MKIDYNGWVLDSQEELYFCWWLEELKSEKFIHSFERAESINVFDPVLINYSIDSNGTQKAVKILRELNYTPDFLIRWNKKAEGIFYTVPGNYYPKEVITDCIFTVFDPKESYVDVKGLFNGPRLSTSITFPFVQKLMYHVNNIYIQKIVPLGEDGLFAKTFTPKKYLTTKTGKERKIKWDIKLLKDLI